MITKQQLLEDSIAFWHGQAMWALNMFERWHDDYYLEQYIRCEQLRKRRSYQLAEHKNIITS